LGLIWVILKMKIHHHLIHPCNLMSKFMLQMTTQQKWCKRLWRHQRKRIESITSYTKSWNISKKLLIFMMNMWATCKWSPKMAICLDFFHNENRFVTQKNH
jgi:hypothetical protein